MHRTIVYFLGAVLATLNVNAFAEAEPPHPMVDFPRTVPLPIEALQQLDTGELESRRDGFAERLKEATDTPVAELEQQLLQALLTYDEERIRIIDIIPNLVEHYEMDEILQQDMMNFRRALAKIVEELRPEITTLQRYKPYDFRIGVSYAAMMTILQKKQEVRDRMLEDQKNPDSMLGQHTTRLRSNYAAVESARERLALGYESEALQKQIDQIDTELRRRRQS